MISFLFFFQIGNGYFSPNNPDEFRDIYNNLMYHDRFYTLADFDAYMKAQDEVNRCYSVRRPRFAFISTSFLVASSVARTPLVANFTPEFRRRSVSIRIHHRYTVVDRKDRRQGQSRLQFQRN